LAEVVGSVYDHRAGVDRVRSARRSMQVDARGLGSMVLNSHGSENAGAARA